MLLPKDLLSGTYRAPDMFLCETNKEKICKLDPIGLNGAFKFNSYSELTFDVARVYNDMLTGQTHVNPYYNKIEAIRLVYLDGFGYFELQDPEIDGDGIKEVKSLTAYSSEYTLSQKYLELFRVNTGEVDSIEVMYAEEHEKTSIEPVTFYNPENPELSLLHLILEKAYGWSIGHVDDSLRKLRRQFSVDRESIYDFIMNEICDKFNCYAIFDTVNNTINFYAEALTNRFNGDGTTNTFTVSPVFTEIGTVSVDGYKTINYTYNNVTGELVLGNTPLNGTIIEVTDGALSSWETDVYVTFDNLAQEMNISYSADDIKTVLTVKGAGDLDIREVNNGLPYIVDLSYFYDKEKSWMGEELYDAYTDYLKKCNERQAEYKSNAQEILKYSSKIWYETNRLSLQYSVASVAQDTVGTYYVRGGDETVGYYYTEVSLPSEWVAGTTYYSIHGSNLNEEKVSDLYDALKTYYHNEGDMSGFEGDEAKIVEGSFDFMEEITLEDLIDTLSSADIDDAQKDLVVVAFFNEMWEQIGLTPLKTLYRDPYKQRQTVNVNAGWAQKGNDNYGLYYPVVLILESIEKTIAKKQAIVDAITKEMSTYTTRNAEIGTELLIANNFTDEQMLRLSAFLREDEYTDDNFVETEHDTSAKLFQTKQELLECGRIELSKLCEPRLKFSMSLANIYALPEFAPIVNQFQLGNLIKIALRPDYVKHTRLMQVNLNFEDFSDFSCEFGDLSSVRSQTDMHADLLSQAVSAGKTVASNASYWDDGSDTANSIDVRLQQGLLNAIESIKDIDGNQAAFIDKYGIHLQEVIDKNTGEVSPEQGWIVNNKFLYSDDGFKTTKSVFGKYTIDDQNYWGLLADAVIAGYIEGSTIKGGTIQIGERPDGGYNFEVDTNGYITMTGGKSGSGAEINFDDYNTEVELVADSTVLGQGAQSITLTCKVSSYGIDITDDDNLSFRWIRSTENEDADSEWNSANENIAHGNTLVVTANDVEDVAFFQCQVHLATGNTKLSNSISITTNDSDINIFTSKPGVAMLDGYCYHEGDLWVIGSDYQPSYYECGIIEHTHTNACYNVTCGLEEHVHDESCYDEYGNPICGILPHEHDDSCFATGSDPICGFEEHTHDETLSSKQYPQNTIMICVKSNTEYSDDDWVESVYCSKTFADVQAWQNDMQEHVVVKEDGLHLIGSTDGTTSFESVLTSQNLTFRSNDGGKETDVVWLGVSDMNARDTTIISHLNVTKESETANQDVYINLGGYRNKDGNVIGGFKFQIEENGSLSLV